MAYQHKQDKNNGFFFHCKKGVLVKESIKIFPAGRTILIILHINSKFVSVKMVFAEILIERWYVVLFVGKVRSDTKRA